MNLDCIQYVKTNGLKCAKISETDVEQRIEYWNSSIVCCVLGGNDSFAVCSLPWRIMIRFLKGGKNKF